MQASLENVLDTQHKKKTADTDSPPEGLEWVWAGFKALAAEGLEGIKVEKLAKRLGVSKGPFYWRYANRDALMLEMLALWKQFTVWMIEQNTSPTSARARVESLADGVLQVKWRGVDVVRVESAIRAWAAKDSNAAQVVSEVDRMRVGFLQEQLREIGVPAERSGLMAHGIYLGLGGFYAAHQYTPEMANASALRALVDMWLDQAEAIASRNEHA